MSDKISDKSEKKSIGGELVIPVLATVFVLYYFTTIIDSPWTAQVSAFFIGTVLLLLIAILVAKSIKMLARKESDLGLHSLVAPTSYIPKRLILLGLTLAYSILIEWGGFTLTTFVFLFLSMFMLSNWTALKKSLILSVVFSIGGYLLFVVAFETRFPAGPFETLVKGLF
ncbi:tripartite tricarboxylate transporter TctB family protein [Pseudomonadota bacterium]